MKIKHLLLLTLLFLLSFPTYAQFNPRPNWKDSYKANGLCFCITDTGSAFDHGITKKTVKINGKDFGVKEVCLALRKHPKWVDFREAEKNKDKYGYIPYNDIQCGNGPANDAPDEAGCPGRVDIGSKGCNTIGPGWDFDWLSKQSQFQGDGTGGTGEGSDNDADLGEEDQRGTGGSGVGEGPKSTLIFPTKNKRFTAPATFRVEADATDIDGVKSAKLSINGKVIDTKTEKPFVWSPDDLKNVPYQKYNNQSTIFIQVDIEDNKGNITSVDSLVYILKDDSENTDAPVGSIISIKPVKSSKINNTFDFLSVRFNENGILKANQPAEREWERFTVEKGNEGNIRLKAKNFNSGSKYLVVSGNTIAATSSSGNVQGSEFKWVTVNENDKTFGLQSVLTGKYVQIPQNKNKIIAVLNVKGAALGDWELFEYNIITAARNTVATGDDKRKTSNTGILINTNPVKSGFIGLSNANGAIFSIRTLGGEQIELGTVTHNYIDVSNLSSGVYIVQFKKNGKEQVEKVIIK